MIDLAKEIWQTMSSNRLRTLLTGFSVAWGIFMLLLLLGLSKGLLNQGLEFQEKNDPNRITVYSDRTTMPYKGLPEGRLIPLRARDIPAIERSNPMVASVSGTKYLKGAISSNLNSITGSANGVYPQEFSGLYTLLSGRFINHADIAEKRKVAVLHRKNAYELFFTEDAVGKTIKIGNNTFRVVGVFDHSWDSDTYVPFTTAVALTGFDDTVGNLNVYLKDVTDTVQSHAVGASAKTAIAANERFDPSDPGAVYLFDRFESYLRQQDSNVYLTYAMWVIGILTLLTGIVGVSNIMFVSVRERTHEIGIRRAIGAKPRKILGQIILESVALTTVFGYIGIVMGTLGTEAITAYFADSDYAEMLHPTVDFSIAIEVTVALIIAGALAGIFPAVRALKIKPVEALQEE